MVGEWVGLLTQKRRLTGSGSGTSAGGGRVWPNHGNRKLADNGNVGFGKEI